jgi:flagellar motor switch protein FliM
MKELSSLQIGDVLDLGKKRKEGVILRIENKNKFQAHLGLIGKFRGLSITKEIEEEK